MVGSFFLTAYVKKLAQKEKKLSYFYYTHYYCISCNHSITLKTYEKGHVMSEAETEKNHWRNVYNWEVHAGGGFVQSETINKFAQIVLEDAICGPL